MEVTMGAFFIADLHLGGSYAYKFYGRPFAKYKTYERTMLDNIRNTVTQKDDLYIVGDFLDFEPIAERDHSWEYGLSLVDVIPGRKHLILGNNEERLIKFVLGSFEEFETLALKAGFAECAKDKVVNVEGNLFYLNHYYENSKLDMLNLYGHAHRERAVSARGFNVCCELTGYYPMSSQQLITIFERTLTYSLPHKHIPNVKYFDKELWNRYRNVWWKQITQLYK